MQTLFITSSYLEGNNGGIYASRTHINLFSELSERMTLLYPYKKGQKVNGINVTKIDMVPVEDHRSNFKKFIDLCLGKVHRFKLTDEYINRGRYDVVVFDGSVCSSGFVNTIRKDGIKVITIHHNYQIEYLLGDCNPLILIPSLFWTWIYEGQAVRNSNLNITLTQQDVELLQKHYAKDAKMEVLGVYEYGSSETTELPDEPRGHHYVMTGALGFKQTENSLVKWINDYFPILKDVDPEAQLTIAGSNPSLKLSQFIKKSGIRLIPSPPDMTPILLEADYYLNPVDRGGGLKLRNLDGLKFGLPVLSHKVSLRGYEKMQALGLLLAYDNKLDFKEGIQNLHKISLKKKEIRDSFLKQYQFTCGVERLKTILRTYDFI